MSGKLEVEALLDEFCEAYQSRNSERLVDSLTRESTPVVVGIGSAERRVGVAEIRDQLDRDFEAADEAKIEISWHTANQKGEAAWVIAETMVTVKADESEILFPARFSGFACLEDGNWRWAHWHFSLPPTDAGWPL